MVKSLFNGSAAVLNAVKLESVAQNLAMLVESGSIAPDTVSIAGFASLSEAVERSPLINKNEKKQDDLFHALLAKDEYLRRMNAAIAELEQQIIELEEKRFELLEMAQEAYELAFEAEELSSLITDGISDNERERLVKLLGEDARDASIEELQSMLEEAHENFTELGDKYSQDASDILEKENAKSRELEELIKARDVYLHSSPEKREAIRARDKNSHSDEALEKADHLTVNPDFTVPNFG